MGWRLKTAWLAWVGVLIARIGKCFIKLALILMNWLKFHLTFLSYVKSVIPSKQNTILLKKKFKKTCVTKDLKVALNEKKEFVGFVCLFVLFLFFRGTIDENKQVNWEVMEWLNKQQKTTKTRMSHSLVVAASCQRSGQNHLARHSERGKKTRQTEEEVGRQHQGLNGQAWNSPSPGRQWRTEKNGGNWLLWRANDPRGSVIGEGGEVALHFTPSACLAFHT